MTSINFTGPHATVSLLGDDYPMRRVPVLPVWDGDEARREVHHLHQIRNLGGRPSRPAHKCWCGRVARSRRRVCNRHAVNRRSA